MIFARNEGPYDYMTCSYFGHAVSVRKLYGKRLYWGFCGGELNRSSGPAMAVCKPPADWVVPVHVHAHCFAIPQFLPNVKIYSFAKINSRFRNPDLTLIAVGV
jgi:hypothetical protein